MNNCLISLISLFKTVFKSPLVQWQEIGGARLQEDPQFSETLVQ